MLTYGNKLNEILERFYRYEWDEAKNIGNAKKHRGLTLFNGSEIFLDNSRVILKDERFDYGESRYIAIGKVDCSILSVCFTPRAFLKRRLISVRYASRKERRMYYGNSSYDC